MTRSYVAAVASACGGVLLGTRSYAVASVGGVCWVLGVLFRCYFKYIERCRVYCSVVSPSLVSLQPLLSADAALQSCPLHPVPFPPLCVHHIVFVASFVCLALAGTAFLCVCPSFNSADPAEPFCSAPARSRHVVLTNWRLHFERIAS